jgi:polyisoprenoid-binding protein YceI
MTTTATPAQQLRDGTAAGTWTLDPTTSTITTATKHFWGLITVHGTFTDASGHTTVTPDGAITGELEVDAASINTKNKKRDEHLRSDDFFNAEHHPTITFTTTDVTITGDTTAHVTGTVTAGGAQQEVIFDATITAGHHRGTINADISIDHRALGMTWSPLGMAKPATTLSLSLAFTRN